MACIDAVRSLPRFNHCHYLNIISCGCRYLVTILGGSKNVLYSTVRGEIIEALLHQTADHNKKQIAIHRDKVEQERRLEKVYRKWASHRNVWSQASAKVCCLFTVWDCIKSCLVARHMKFKFPTFTKGVWNGKPAIFVLMAVGLKGAMFNGILSSVDRLVAWK